MARDELNDYEELLKSFESRKTETASKNNGSQKSGFSGTKTDFGDYESERRKKVQDFKIDLDTEASTDKPNLKGGVYFSNPPKDIGEHAQREKEAAAGANIKQGTDKFTVSTPPTTYAQKKAIAKKKAKAKKRAERAEKYSEKIKGKKGEAFLALFSSENLSKNVLNLAIIILVSVILCVYGIGCINDVLALNGDDKTVEVTVSNKMTDSDVIDILKKQGLIRNKLFCKLFIKVLDKDGTYVSGEYTLNENMGIEKMLATMKADITLSETITLTFPEGWTIDQIAEKLETNDVCRASDFINTLQSVDFSEEYSFVAAIPNKELRYRTLEGYIYPDTYEFYIGENASSVVRRFLDNFETRWTTEYQKRADEMGVSVDEIITMASILQGEAASADQMEDISSILYNRLNRSSAFPWLQCDSTEDYLLKTIKPSLTSSTEDTEKYIRYRDNYDTYSTECTGLPVGAICNPGNSAIKAALYPSDTDYFYFRHDDKGNVYYASSLAEHEANGRKIAND